MKGETLWEGRFTDDDVLVDFDEESYGGISSVFLSDFYIARSYSVSVSDSSITITLNNPKTVDVASNFESYYFDGNRYNCSSAPISGYYVLYNGDTSYTCSGRGSDHLGYKLTWFGIGWSSSVGGNEVRYSKTLVPKINVIKTLSKTEYIDCDTKQYTSTSYAGSNSLSYTYYADPSYGTFGNANGNETYYKLLN